MVLARVGRRGPPAADRYRYRSPGTPQASRPKSGSKQPAGNSSTTAAPGEAKIRLVNPAPCGPTTSGAAANARIWSTTLIVPGSTQAKPRSRNSAVTSCSFTTRRLFAAEPRVT